jgi:hypothetical protein
MLMKRTAKPDESERLIEITLEVGANGRAQSRKRSVMKVARSSKKIRAKTKRRS